MAERSNAPDIKEHWLSLAAKWLAFAEQASGNRVTEFEAMPEQRNGTAGYCIIQLTLWGTWRSEPE